MVELNFSTIAFTLINLVLLAAIVVIVIKYVHYRKAKSKEISQKLDKVITLLEDAKKQA